MMPAALILSSWLYDDCLGGKDGCGNGRCGGLCLHVWLMPSSIPPHSSDSVAIWCITSLTSRIVVECRMIAAACVLSRCDAISSGRSEAGAEDVVDRAGFGIDSKGSFA